MPEVIDTAVGRLSGFSAMQSRWLTLSDTLVEPGAGRAGAGGGRNSGRRRTRGRSSERRIDPRMLPRPYAHQGAGRLDRGASRIAKPRTGICCWTRCYAAR